MSDFFAGRPPFCTVCDEPLRTPNWDKSQLVQHTKTQKHKKAVDVASSMKVCVCACLLNVVLIVKFVCVANNVGCTATTNANVS
jgi:hypothetical protein